MGTPARSVSASADNTPTPRMTRRAPGATSTHGLVGMSVNAMIIALWNAAPGHGSLRYGEPS